MKEVSYNDKMKFCNNKNNRNNCTSFAGDLTVWSKNFTAPDKYYRITLDRKVSHDEIKNTKLEKMPGFRLSWNNYTKIKPEDRFSNDVKTKEFVRIVNMLDTTKLDQEDVWKV